MTNSETFKQLSAVFEQAFLAQADGVRKNCTHCKGDGIDTWHKRADNGPMIIGMSVQSVEDAECRFCTPERQRLLDRAKAFCWHTWSVSRNDMDIKHGTYTHKCSCGFTQRYERLKSGGCSSNPTFTIDKVDGYESITAVLDELKDAKSFSEFHWDELDEFLIAMEDYHGLGWEWGEIVDIVAQANAEILQNADTNAQAVISHLNSKN